MVVSNVEELQKAWDDLNDLLEEKEKELEVKKLDFLIMFFVSITLNILRSEPVFLFLLSATIILLCSNMDITRAELPKFDHLPHIFPLQKAEKARKAEEKLQDLKVLVADLDAALASPDSGTDPSSAKQIAKKYDVSFMWFNC